MENITSLWSFREMETPYPYLIFGTRTTWNYLSFIALCKSSNHFLFAMSVPAILHCLSRFKHLKILHSKKSEMFYLSTCFLPACDFQTSRRRYIYFFLTENKQNFVCITFFTWPPANMIKIKEGFIPNRNA